jgi:hypothetical protein
MALYALLVTWAPMLQLAEITGHAKIKKGFFLVAPASLAKPLVTDQDQRARASLYWVERFTGSSFRGEHEGA